jgi:ATP-dependent RNA helicase TDRD9
VGTLVGYQVGLDKQMDTNSNSDTRILFVTTGVLLQKLINEKTMNRYSHIILDEVHERDLNLDMLLLVVRFLLSTRNPNVKIILMSATLIAEKFASYFPKITDGVNVLGPAPVLELDVKRPFKVRISYLDEFKASHDIIDSANPGISNAMYDFGLKAMERVLSQTQGRMKPSFLIFLPGIQEIRRFKEKLLKPNANLNISNFTISILHSSIPVEDYGKAFDGHIENRIILATNIAESSVTLPGVRFVFDFCLTKYLQADTATNMTQLKLDWASKMSLEQRAGRVGRTEVGQVVRFIFKEHFEQLLDETIPEIQRTSLESVVLKAKQLDMGLNMGKPSNVLGKALDPPSESSIEDSILVLKEIGGLTRFNKSGKFNAKDGEMTFAGNVMAKLPVDVRISKLIILGYMFGCLEECIIIGVGMSTKSIFRTNLRNRNEKMSAYHQRLEAAKGSGSDSIAVLSCYRNWQHAKAKGLSGKNELKWCEFQMLELRNLRDMHEQIEDIKNRLHFFRLTASPHEFSSTKDEKILTIKMCLAGAFYPNYFEFGGRSPSKDENDVLNDMDPCTTVYFKRFKLNRIGQLYEQQVRENLKEAGVCDELNDMKVKFDSNSQKLHVQFKPFSTENDELVPGEVSLEVYKSVKLRKMSEKIELNLMR